MIKPAFRPIVREYGKCFYIILIRCFLSLRIRDLASLVVLRELFKYIGIPQKLL